ncbi:MAG: protein TolQ [Mariprofundales bacterium]
MVSDDLSVIVLVLNAGPVVKGVLILLAFLILWSWVIAFNKLRLYNRVRKDAKAFSATFWGGSDMDTILSGIPSRYPNSPLPNLFQSGYREFLRYQRSMSKAQQDKIVAAGGIEGISRAMDAALSREIERLGRHLSLLATVGSTAPFIGLFGTVWGIMNAFQNIGLTQNTSLAAVAPGIAEALVATAFGLIAAIPAVVAYNTFASDMEQIISDLQQFSSEFQNIIARHIKA